MNHLRSILCMTKLNKCCFLAPALRPGVARGSYDRPFGHSKVHVSLCSDRGDGESVGLEPESHFG